VFSAAVVLAVRSGVIADCGDAAREEARVCRVCSGAAAAASALCSRAIVTAVETVAGVCAVVAYTVDSSVVAYCIRAAPDSRACGRDRVSDGAAAAFVAPALVSAVVASTVSGAVISLAKGAREVPCGVSGA
jgi:hypothetical protein